MTNIHLESLKCFLVCLEELSYLNTPLSSTRTFREKAVVVVRKVALCFSIKMITNSISCLYCLDGSDIFYIVYIVCIVCIFAGVSVFNEVFSACGYLVSNTVCQHNNRANNM